MKKELAVLTLAISMASTAPAFAGDTPTTKKQPVKMTDKQLDDVAGGLVTIVAVDVVDVQTGDILRTVNVPANAAIAVLGNAVAGQRFFFRPRP